MNIVHGGAGEEKVLIRKTKRREELEKRKGSDSWAPTLESNGRNRRRKGKEREKEVKIENEE